MKREAVFPDRWLKADHLVNDKGQPTAVRLTIIGLEDVTYPDKSVGRAAIFKETDKKLGLNVTNWGTLAQMSGQNPDDPNADDEKFVGMKVEIYRTMVEYKGKNVPGLRVRPVGGWEKWTAPLAAKPEPVPAPEEGLVPSMGEEEELPF